MSQDEQHVLQKELSDFLIKDVFNTITEEDILTITDKNEWWYRGKRLDQERVTQLKEASIKFLDSALWRFLYSELQYNAVLKTASSKTEADMIAAKQMVHIMTVMRGLLEKMAR